MNKYKSAFYAICFYYSLEEDIIKWKEIVKKPYDRVEIHNDIVLGVIYSICVMLYGDYGTSPLSGWIIDVRGFYTFIDDVCINGGF